MQAAFTAGRVNTNAGARTADPVASTVTGQPLPAGYRYAPNGRLQGPDGRWATDPTAPPNSHNRDTEYPSGYRQPTHDSMTTRYTEEGQVAGGPPRDPATGERIPRDQLTWYDSRGRPVPADQLTYEHHRPVVQHWNDEGRFTSRSERNDWYNDPSNLSPMSRPDNSRGGSLMQDRYIQDTGPGYSNDSSND
ncbi:GH-E family nuclease [Actinoplanes sp. NBRC 103695]|uniref:GH-E family nuclease n=1 Tax=Actinoplanes sp. NBRC 103695 TaxID=3032202 RepID=UPI002556AE6C|nr:GH-E family nuclease [Actinoplanes sp. NBRC 103695]